MHPREKTVRESSGFNIQDKEYMERIPIPEYLMSLGDDLEGYLPEDERLNVLKQTNKQSACINFQSHELRELRQKGLIDDFRHMQFQKVLGEFLALQGKAERIKNFPYPRQFATLNFFFIWLFVILLPLGLVHEFDEMGVLLMKSSNGSAFYHAIADHFVWVSIPFVVTISWVFMTMERIGDVSENPFEGIANDVPISNMARGIPKSTSIEMIGEPKEDIPAPRQETANIQM